MALPGVTSRCPRPRSTRGLYLRNIALGIGLLAQTASALPSSAPALPPGLEESIGRFIRESDLETLLGQMLMVGVQAKEDKAEQEWSRANESLAGMVRTYRLGGVLLFEGNFPPQYKSKDLETPAIVASLTLNLQKQSFDSQPAGRKVPLLIAMDQEGGSRMIVTSGVTRIASPVFLGNARSEPLARRAGEVVGSEMKALGVNTVLAPVVDVNNSAQNDIIGKRAFGARPDLVASLAGAFARGLRQSGVLAVAKHYPGHGTSAGDPHFVLPRQGYDDFSQLEQSDLPPFERLVAEGVDGVMTAHILSPIDALPVTISSKAIDGLLRREPTSGLPGLGFQGVVFTDDLTSMMGILLHVHGKKEGDEIGNEESVLVRSEVARRALEAGTDVLLFGQLWLEEDEIHPERSLTLEEFKRIYEQLRAYFREPGRRPLLERAVRRILIAKANRTGWGGAEDLSVWQPPWNENSYRELLEKNHKVAVEIAQRSAVVIREGGRTIHAQNPSSYFAPGKGPLSKGVLLGEEDRMTVVGPAFRPPNAFYEAIVQDGWLPRERINQVSLVYGWRSPKKLEEASRLWGFPVERLSLLNDRGQPDYSKTRDAIRRKADEILARAAGSQVIVFGVLLREHVEVLREVCRRLESDRTKKIVVVSFLEPYFLVPESSQLDLYNQPNAIFLYVSPTPDMALATKFLYGEPEWVPHDVSYLSVPIPGIANRGEILGAAIEMDPPPAGHDAEVEEDPADDHPEPESTSTPAPTHPTERLETTEPDTSWTAATLGVSLLALASGLVIARGRRRRAEAVAEAQMLPFPIPDKGVNNFWYRTTEAGTAIVFVHGIFSDSRRCWLYRDAGGSKAPAYWPHLIKDDPRFGEVAIFLGGYYTAIDAADYGLDNCADELHGALSRRSEKPGERRPLDLPRLLFVCHSTGGIVVRYMLERYAADFAATRVGLLLIASPSLGAGDANRLAFLSRIYRQKLARQLRVGSESLEDLHSRFKELVDSRRIPGLCGREAYEHHSIFHWKWWPSSWRVVSKESAGVYFAEPVSLRGTNHFGAVKPDSRQHPAYELLVDFWNDFFADPVDREHGDR